MKYKVKVASDGYAIGTILKFNKNNKKINKGIHFNKEEEKKRFLDVSLFVGNELDNLYKISIEEIGEESASIFNAHKMIVTDPEFIKEVTNIIDTFGYCAEYSIQLTSAKFVDMFEKIEDEYLSARAADFKDVCKTLVNKLQNNDEVLSFNKETIVYAKELVPSEVIKFDTNVIGIITQKGSINSHVSILARSKNIPLVFAEQDLVNSNGKKCLINGINSEIIIEPSIEEENDFNNQINQLIEEQETLNIYKKKSVNYKGKNIEICANLNDAKEIDLVLSNNADGIGLLRTEFLYLESRKLPTEEEQFIYYKNIIENMNGKNVVIRTLDVGSDKKIDYIKFDKEENPALGLRGIRVSFDKINIFKTQLRAIYRASYFGNVSIMFPMIISVDEIIKIKKIVAEVKLDLDKENILYKSIPFGIMIETPAAALISSELAKHVDFFSIGSNDLTQYTLGIDRQNENLEQYYDPYHDSVFSLIKMTIENAHKENIKVCICGELGSDLNATKKLLDLGIDKFSVSASSILKLKRNILG